MKTRKVQLSSQLTLHTESFGNIEDQPCLLIAGAMATARLWTDFFCQTLVNSGLFVIRYDHRDIGESSAVNWKKTPYSLFDLAKDAIDILDDYGIKQAHVVGHSMGGYICQRIALEYPHYVSRMVAISAGPIAATAETDIPLTSQEKSILNKTWKTLLARKDGDSIETGVQNFLPVWRYLSGSLPFDEEIATAYTRDLLVRSQHKIRVGSNHELVMRHLELDKYRDALQNVRIPTLVIHGDSDSLVLPREGRALAHAIPHATLQMIPGMGHMFFNRNLESKIIDLLLEPV